MRRPFPVLAALLAAGASLAALPAPPPAPPAAAAPATPRPPRFPGFAAQLAEQPPVTGPAGWKAECCAAIWKQLARSTAATRQPARWAYARAMIDRDAGGEALGVLDVMAADDPDLALVPAWQLARGAALELVGRHAEAIELLARPSLDGNAEGCAWQLRAAAAANLAQAALARVDCALPAINARRGLARRPFVLAAIRAALTAGRPALASQWLPLLRDSDPAANLYRGQAALAQGQAAEGKLRLERVVLSGSPEQRQEARLALLEWQVDRGSIPPAKAIPAIDTLRYGWRGGPLEERALRLEWRVAGEAGDLRHSLAAGATLIRHFALGPAAAPILEGLRAQLAEALAPDSMLALPVAAGLYWDFRDLAPMGAEGDALVSRLAGRLESAGLYQRAAQLLHYQLTARTHDVAQGPLSAHVATLYILAGRPDQALGALRETDTTPFPPDMLADRRRVQAAALQQLGRSAEAMAVLDEVPDSQWLRAEIAWRRRDWSAMTAAVADDLPRPGRLSEVGQAAILRQAIGLAMLDRGPALAQLRQRYAASFAGLASAPAFDLLTRPIERIDPSAVSAAMAALPSGSPAGGFADLLEARIARAGAANP